MYEIEIKTCHVEDAYYLLICISICNQTTRCYRFMYLFLETDHTNRNTSRWQKINWTKVHFQINLNFLTFLLCLWSKGIIVNSSAWRKFYIWIFCFGHFIENSRIDLLMPLEKVLIKIRKTHLWIVPNHHSFLGWIAVILVF